MLGALLRLLKAFFRKGKYESDLIRDRNPSVLSPDVRRALKELKQKCEEASGDKADAK